MTPLKQSITASRSKTFSANYMSYRTVSMLPICISIYMSALAQREENLSLSVSMHPCLEKSYLDKCSQTTAAVPYIPGAYHLRESVLGYLALSLVRSRTGVYCACTYQFEVSNSPVNTRTSSTAIRILTGFFL